MRKAVRAIIIRHQSILLMKRNNFGREYYTLIGGGIEPGELAPDALIRELAEEASITITSPKLVFIEKAAPKFGTQYIFTCDYKAGEVAIHPSSEEAADNKIGHNLYQPLWVPVSKLASLSLVSEVLKSELLRCMLDGFPNEPKLITSSN
jgi:8-oxo-dGTP pyrophosphatase MutT (NUDIX family)